MTDVSVCYRDHNPGMYCSCTIEALLDGQQSCNSTEERSKVTQLLMQSILSSPLSPVLCVSLARSLFLEVFRDSGAVSPYRTSGELRYGLTAQSHLQRNGCFAAIESLLFTKEKKSAALSLAVCNLTI